MTMTWTPRTASAINGHLLKEQHVIAHNWRVALESKTQKLKELLSTLLEL